MDLEAVSAADFLPHRDTSFRVVGTDFDGLEVRLTDVDELPVQPNAPRPESFSLVFAGPGRPMLEQRTYRLAHPVIGELEIFLVPIGYSAEGGLLYEAVFN